MSKATRYAAVGLSCLVGGILGLVAMFVVIFLQESLSFGSLIAVMLILLAVAAIVSMIRGIGGKVRYVLSVISFFLVPGLTVYFFFLPVYPVPVGARVTRARTEMRNLAVYLEAYLTDHSTYPPAVDENGNVVPYDEGGVSSGYVTWMLTTPYAYVSRRPLDPLHKWPEKRPDGVSKAWYRYATNGSGCWILMSYGPDQDEDIEIGDYVDPGKGNCDLQLFLSQYGKGNAVEYDSTNGSTSSGDIIRVGP